MTIDEIMSYYSPILPYALSWQFGESVLATPGTHNPATYRFARPAKQTNAADLQAAWKAPPIHHELQEIKVSLFFQLSVLFVFYNSALFTVFVLATFSTLFLVALASLPVVQLLQELFVQCG